MQQIHPKHEFPTQMASNPLKGFHHHGDASLKSMGLKNHSPTTSWLGLGTPPGPPTSTTMPDNGEMSNEHHK